MVLLFHSSSIQFSSSLLKTLSSQTLQSSCTIYTNKQSHWIIGYTKESSKKRKIHSILYLFHLEKKPIQTFPTISRLVPCVVSVHWSPAFVRSRGCTQTVHSWSWRANIWRGMDFNKPEAYCVQGSALSIYREASISERKGDECRWSSLLDHDTEEDSEATAAMSS